MLGTFDLQHFSFIYYFRLLTYTRWSNFLVSILFSSSSSSSALRIIVLLLIIITTNNNIYVLQVLVVVVLLIITFHTIKDEEPGWRWCLAIAGMHSYC